MHPPTPAEPSPIDPLPRPRLVCVDDEPLVLELMERMVRLRGLDWAVKSFTDSREAWEFLRGGDADVVVTDIVMPKLSGPELVKLLRENEATRDTPVVVVTGLHEGSLKRQVLDLGATDLLGKPIEPDDLVARLKSALRLKQFQDALKRQNDYLEEMVNERTRQLQASRIEIIWRLAKAAEFRDEQTGSHVLRVAHYSRIVAESLGQTRHFVETLFLSAPLHDLGKIGIADAILHKPGELTEEERRQMRMHCEIGERILSQPKDARQLMTFSGGACPDEAFFSNEDPVLQMAREIAACHHEHWDGGGYPRGLAGPAIPLSARITAIADVYDALTSARSYKTAQDSNSARAMIAAESGRHFDPRVCAAFLRSIGPIEEIRLRLSDSNPPNPTARATSGAQELAELPLVSDALLTAVPLTPP